MALSPVRVRRVLAPNPGPFTLEGTNTWIVRAAAASADPAGPSLVIDPGPDDPGHIEAVRRQAEPVAAILLTHHHPDHAPGANRLAAATGAPVLSFRPGPGPAGPADSALRDGGTVQAEQIQLRVIHAPGHTPDHVVFAEMASRSLFTGDTVLGRGTSVIDPPEGDLAAYLGSLERLRAMEPRVLYPGHGPAVWDAVAKLDEYLEHRAERERQVLQGLRKGPRSPEQLVPGIYQGYPDALYPAAARSILAHLLKLEADGRVGRDGDDRFRLRRQRRQGRGAATTE